MRIAVFALMYPALSEGFLIREIAALRDLGYELGVFVNRDVSGPRGEPVEGVPVARWEERSVRSFRPELLYGSLGVPAHRQTGYVSSRMRLPFVLRVWSGMDTFQYPSPAFYSRLSRSPHCRAVVVEDEFMMRYAASRMAVFESKLRAIPNSLDVSAWTPRVRNGGPPYVLAIGRFVEKKGFIHLIRAMRTVNTELRIVGYGPLEDELRAAAGPNVTFLGARPLADLPELYAGAAVCVFPCVRTTRGDADGIPTTALEAMAMGRPVIVSDLLSAPCYVAQGETGVLVPPGDEEALSRAILGLLSEPEMAEAMGARARAWAEEHLDIRKNARALESILLGACPVKAIA